MNRRISRSLTAIMLVFALAVSGTFLTTAVETVYASQVTGIAFAKSKLILAVGKSADVKIKIKPGGASYGGVSWGISPAGVVESDLEYTEDGGIVAHVEAVNPGTAVITVKISTFETKLTVTVTGKSVQKRTKKQIRAFLKKNKVSTTTKITYKKKPKTKSPYSAGELSSKTMNSALKMLNNIRYIAGLNADVKLNSSYSKMAQAASLVNAVNNMMSHYPSQPKGMSSSLYQLGYTGASSSNIAWGYSYLNEAILKGWMSDSDEYNIDRVGHRRWILNPSMKKTGFGAVDTHSAMYCFDTSGTGKQTNIYWPAQTMPVEYFNDGDAWSVSTGQILNKKKIKVTVTRTSDNKKWTFSSKTKSSSKNSGYFNVENSNYGLQGCIIFRPNNLKCSSGDKFKVKITGVPTGTISYTVSFFKL